MSKGSSVWVKSTFDDFGQNNCERNSQEEQKPKKRSREQNAFKLLGRKPSGVSGTELWVDVYAPTSRDDLAVHKKKVQEVESWIVESLAGMKGRKFLLLTGPAGCGKTATLKVLAREAGIHIQEWINTTTSTFSKGFAEQENTWIPGDQVQSVGQMSQLQDFLMRASKYKSVCTSKQQGTIVFMEEFPNAVLRNPMEFHHLLRRYSMRSGSSPCVFLVSDSTVQQGSMKHLFPPELQQELSIINISFNPVATSQMVRAMSRVLSMDSTCEQDGGKPLPPKDALTALADASSGDVRSAINALQFAAKKDVYQLEELFTGNTTTSGRSGPKSKARKTGSTNSKSSKAKGDKEQVLASVGGKDASLFLFRALGKVLYCKRETDKGIVDHLPSHFAKHERSPLVETPELIYDKASLSASSFSCFLHHNCLPFFNNIDSVDHAMSYITDADVFAEQWESREKLEDYSASVCIRGMMHALGSNSNNTNTSSSHGKGWRPLTKPQWYGTSRRSQENYAALSAHFRMSSLTAEELTTNVVPLYAKIVASTRAGLSGIFREIGSMSDTISSRITEEGLGEHDLDDCSTLADDTVVTPIAEQDVLKTLQTQEYEEDDFVIEEYED